MTPGPSPWGYHLCASDIGRHTLKTELISLEDYDTREEAQTAVFEYIEVFYNRQRCHSANGYLAPLLYEQTLTTNEILCPEKC